MAECRRQASEASCHKASLRRGDRHPAKTAEALRSVVLPHSPSYRVRNFGSCGRVLAASRASEHANATSEPDALANEDESGRAWNWREVGRYGVIKWFKALLHGKTRGVDHSDFELVNAAIRQEQRRRNAATSGEARSPTEEASPSASILLETTPPQVHWQSRVL